MLNVWKTSFIKYLQADDTEYVRTVTRKTFAAAVARIYVPGIKFDCVPVLDGEQGIGKSTIVKTWWVRVLFGNIVPYGYG